MYGTLGVLYGTGGGAKWVVGLVSIGWSSGAMRGTGWRLLLWCRWGGRSGFVLGWWRRWRVVVIVLAQEQAAEVRILSSDLGLPESEVVRLLLSGPLSTYAGSMNWTTAA